MRVRQIDFHVVFLYIWINPSEDLPGLVEIDHILVDDKVTVMVYQSTTGINYSLSIGMRSLGVVVFLELADLFIFQVIDPYLLHVRFCLSKNDFRGTFDVFFLSSAVELSFLLCFDRNFDTYFITLLHQ